MVIAIDETKEALATTYTSLGSWISLHTADPGTTGASEASGGSPAYARKQTTWTPGPSDGVSTGSVVTLDVPAGTYGYMGIWDAAVGGNLVDKMEIPPQAMGAQGVIRLTPIYTQT